jgi:hypothetical protein
VTPERAGREARCRPQAIAVATGGSIGAMVVRRRETRVRERPLRRGRRAIAISAAELVLRSATIDRRRTRNDQTIAAGARRGVVIHVRSSGMPTRIASPTSGRAVRRAGRPKSNRIEGRSQRDRLVRIGSRSRAASRRRFRRAATTSSRLRRRPSAGKPLPVPEALVS